VRQATEGFEKGEGNAADGFSRGQGNALLGRKGAVARGEVQSCGRAKGKNSNSKVSLRGPWLFLKYLRLCLICCDAIVEESNPQSI
jgi:hypothetical protein